MTRPADPSPRPRTSLSRDRVLRAALALADRDGIESLSMRKLAEELGTKVMSLYYYVANKDDVLGGILELVIGEIELPPENPDWKAALRRSAISAHEALLRHRWALGVMMSPSRVGPARLRYMDSLLRCLREAGFSAYAAHRAYHALEGHITGFTLWQASLPIRKADVPNLVANFLERISVDKYPYIVEHMQVHLALLGQEGEGDFEFGLDLILDGLERIRVLEQPSG
ncbi:TetR/AcrR family transcriptional regulator [Calidithermus chliarophilus]|uniref:TetR/AcrR family transcriptional regulator n=1 Tax=Calidithermus chliarophilus TaxID=52023 RepID=UPI0004839EB2|nr:TetR/AcrR family transcriptional regulator [Calidithermus chliarophilus]